MKTITLDTTGKLCPFPLMEAKSTLSNWVLATCW